MIRLKPKKFLKQFSKKLKNLYWSAVTRVWPAPEALTPHHDAIDNLSAADLERTLGEIIPNFQYGSVLNDSDFKCAATQAILQKNITNFESAFLLKLTDLEVRSSKFELKIFDDGRLFRWCNMVRSISGHFNLANKYFLTSIGHIIDSETVIERLTRLVDLGLVELERRFGTIGNFEDWTNFKNIECLVARTRLAVALASIGSYSYAFRYSSHYENLVFSILEPRLDISVQLFSRSVIPVVRREKLLLHCESNVQITFERVLRYFDLETSPSNNNIEVIFKSLIGSLRNLEQHAAVLKLSAIICDSNFASFDRYRFSQMLVRSQIEIEPNLAPQILGIEDVRTAEACYTQIDYLMRLGKIVAARRILNHWIKLAQTEKLNTLGALKYVVMLLPAEQVSSFIKNSKRKLLHDSKKKKEFGSEGFAWRSVELTRLQRENDVILSLNRAVKNLISMNMLATQPETVVLEPKSKIILFAFSQDRVSPIVFAPLLPTLQRNGAKFFNLIDDGIENEVLRPWTFSSKLTPNLEALSEYPEEQNVLFNTWVVDFERKIISCNGVNYYQGFFERISRVLKMYSVDWRLPHARRYFALWQRQSDRVISALNDVCEVLRKNSAFASLVSLQSQFAPYFVMKIFAENNSDVLNHITISSSYENWSSNFGGKPISSLTLLNNTKYPSPSMPAFGREEDFKNWYQADFQSSKTEYKATVDQLVGVARSGAVNDEAQKILDFLLKFKATKGRKIFCALGKIPYDLAVPFQSGPAHSDIKDWLNHTVDVFKKSQNLLLIKPHPHELRYDISHKTNETFVELLGSLDLPSNILILPYHGLSLQNLLRFVDTFLCWNGSSIAELGAQGAKIIAADSWADRNYPVNVLLPKSRKGYEQMLNSEIPIEMDKNFVENCIAYVAYMSVAPFALKFPFVGRSPTNSNFNYAWINWDIFDSANLANLEKYEEFLNDTFSLQQ